MTMRLLDDRWYTTEELADILGVDPSTIRRWRTTTPLQGPPFVQLSSSPYSFASWNKPCETD